MDGGRSGRDGAGVETVLTVGGNVQDFNLDAPVAKQNSWLTRFAQKLWTN